VQVLEETDPATIPIRDVGDLVPRRLFLNRKALRGLKDPWQIPDDLARAATTVVE
jgi:hypothetical protein